MGDKDRKQEVLGRLAGVMDPDLGRDIVSLGFVKDVEIRDDKIVKFKLELTTPACPMKARFEEQCRRLLAELPWVEGVEIEMTAKARGAAPLNDAGPGLSRVARVVAVASCKGGVGKSTVAVNLALALAESGAKVGLFDADVFGPSLPTLVRVPDPQLVMENDLIRPVRHAGLTLMSYGYAARSPDEAAIMRGPMVSGVIKQLLTGTDWGELDYLVLDMPPGTGDIQLTLTQIVPISGAVIVTTPQDLSLVDVIKGIEMFRKVKVPTLAVVENMSYFICDGCGKRHHPLGSGARERLAERYGFESTFELPMDAEVSRLGDAGTPLVAAAPDSGPAAVFRELAGAVAREISRVEHGAAGAPLVRWDEATSSVLIAFPGAGAQAVSPAELRRRCACSRCRDERTGERLLKDGEVPDDIRPLEIRPLGNYAVAVDWSDGHSSIYPHDKLLS
jgi:Mrp family chromosome partitioning ATPase/DUF971 family protein